MCRSGASSVHLRVARTCCTADRHPVRHDTEQSSLSAATERTDSDRHRDGDGSRRQRNNQKKHITCCNGGSTDISRNCMTDSRWVLHPAPNSTSTDVLQYSPLSPPLPLRHTRASPHHRYSVGPALPPADRPRNEHEPLQPPIRCLLTVPAARATVCSAAGERNEEDVQLTQTADGGGGDSVCVCVTRKAVAVNCSLLFILTFCWVPDCITRPQSYHQKKVNQKSYEQTNRVGKNSFNSA